MITSNEDWFPFLHPVVAVHGRSATSRKAWFFMAFLLLDTMFQYPMLENVLKAVMIPIKSLTLTFVLGIIIMYSYAFVAFYYFRGDYEGSCHTIGDCTMNTIYQGMRSDIGSALKSVSPESGESW